MSELTTGGINFSYQDCSALEFSADINEPGKWQDDSGKWHNGPFTDILDEISKWVIENENKEAYNKMLENGQIESAVLICNRENKFRLKGVCPNLCILGTDLCDDKVYMVTDRTIADNIREMLKWEDKV